MINENFQPVQWQYKSLPYAEMIKHATIKQGRYDSAMEKMAENASKMGALQRIDQEAYKQQMQEWNEQIGELYDKSGGDWGAMYNPVTSLISKEASKPYYNLNREHVKRYEEMKALDKQLGSDKLTFKELPMSLKDKDGNFIDYKDIDYKLVKKEDWAKAAMTVSEFATTPETRGWADGMSKLTDADFSKPFVQMGSGTTGGIDDIQIAAKMDGAFNLFKNTPEGQQMTEALLSSKEYGNRGKTPKQVDAEMRKFFVDTLNLTKFENSTINYDFRNNPNYNPGLDQNNPGAAISVVNSDRPVNKRPENPNSLMGKLIKISELMGNKIDNKSVKKTSYGQESHAMDLGNLVSMITNSPTDKNQGHKNVSKEAVSLFKEIFEDPNSAFGKISKKMGFNPIINSVEDIKKITSNPMFQAAAKAYDMTDEYYVSKQTVINQNDAAQKQLEGNIKSFNSNYEFTTVDGKKIKISPEKRTAITGRLNLNDGNVYANIDGQSIVISPDEMQVGAGQSAKRIPAINDAFRNNSDNIRFIGPGGIVFRTENVATYVNDGKKLLDATGGLVPVQTNTGTKMIPMMSKIAVGINTNGEEVRYDYETIMKGITSEIYVGMGINSTQTTGKLDQ